MINRRIGNVCGLSDSVRRGALRCCDKDISRSFFDITWTRVHVYRKLSHLENMQLLYAIHFEVERQEDKVVNSDSSMIHGWRLNK